MLTFKFFKKNRIYRKGLTKLLSQGIQNLGRNTLKKIARQIGQFYREALQGTHQKNQNLTQPQLAQIYKKVIQQIISYKHARNIRFTPISRDYNKLWKSKLINAYHVILLFVRQLGFDILTFKPLDDEIFAKIHRLLLYHRHHPDPSMKLSILLQALILTDAEVHKYLETLGKAKCFALLKAFNELVMKDGKIDAEDIKFIFTKHGVEDIYEEWYLKNEDLDDLIKEFNKRKQILLQKGLEYFIEKLNKDGICPTMFDRFYATFKNDDLKHIMLFVANKPERNYSDWIIIYYFLSKNPKLIKYFTNNPLMFKYWFGD